MTEVKLTAEEVGVLRLVLASVAVKDRTGEIGVVHGLDRFVSTNRTLRKAERAALDSVSRKLGLATGVAVHRGD